MRNNMDQNQNQNNQPKMPKFNMNWVYLLVIGALAFFYFQNGTDGLQEQGATKGKATYSEFKNFVNNGYAERIVANKTSETLKMYVKPDSIQSVFHQSTATTGTEPYLSVEYGENAKIEEFIDSARANGYFKGKFDYEHESTNGILSFIVTSLLPIFFLVFLWMFFMRRMGGGGGMGGGIFSVGKSKAKMYEKGGRTGRGGYYQYPAWLEGALRDPPPRAYQGRCYHCSRHPLRTVYNRPFPA